MREKWLENLLCCLCKKSTEKSSLDTRCSCQNKNSKDPTKLKRICGEHLDREGEWIILACGCTVKNNKKVKYA